MQAASRKALDLFIKKADHLGKTRYVQWLTANRGTMLLLSEHKDEIGIERRRPDIDATDAFVLTFRFFIQEGEACSFRALSKTVLADAGMSKRWKVGFTANQDALNAFLDAPTRSNKLVFDPPAEGRNGGMRLQDEAGLTNRAVMSTFIYGDYAHANNAGQRAKYELWKADPVRHALLEVEFDKVMQGVLPSIWRVARLSESELAGGVAPQL